MTIKKIDDFTFPIGEQPLSQDAYYKALSDANSGFYPFGTNGIWHGGIHIDEQVLKKIGRDDKLRCMAHGEVVAYRVNDVYPKMVYNDNIKLEIPYQARQKVAYFSTGFTLVRHYLAMPKIKGSTQAPPSITLYSLYMHQLDWYGYQQKTQESGNQITYPHYWQAVSGIVNQEKADTIKGSVIRENGSQTTVVGLLLKGSKVRLGERHPKKAGWYKIVSITAGTVVTATGFKKELGNMTGYVWHKDIGTQDSERPTGKSADADRDYEICREDNDKLGKPEVAVKGIAIYGSANETQTLTYLPKTASFDFDGQENGYAKIRKISHIDVPALLMAENGNDNAPHKGYVKLTTLTLTHLKPEKLDKVVVLKAPIPINKGDFIGYIGHHVSQNQRFDEPKEAPLANMKRASESQLPQLAHIELFTCDDLPAFINQSQALADRLPDSEKTVILVEKQAQLIQEYKPAGFLRAGLGITFIGNPSHYYVNIYPQYTLTYPTPSPIAFDTKTNQYRLTKQDKANLIAHYQATYPELTVNDIPDEVERITSDSTPANKPTQITLRFIVKNKPYWITSKAVSHLQGKDGQLSSDIRYWSQFPLTLDNLPADKDKDNNIVAYPRTLSLNALAHDGLIAIDDKKEKWVHVTAGNQHGIPITGWVNLKQAHIKQISPWHWHGFNTIEEKATLGELSDKISKNKVTTLELADYTPAMRQLHHILTGTLRYSMQRKKTTQPSFTDGDLKQGLRTSWTAQQIGHLLINYESEWYADEELSKWNEIDSLYEDEKQQKKEIIEEELNKLGLTLPYQRDFALRKLNEAHEHIKTNWQLEKEKRIKPSLWWKEVAEAQTAISNQTTVNANTPILSNLSMDGKAWFIHPVAMMNYFSEKNLLFKKGDKHEIIREINIRLAGFGGNVPTDEFTERTENMIKQFQRDYMNVEETGFVDIEVVKAIDNFSNEYDLPKNEWNKKTSSDSEQMFCPCGKCDGFGKNRYNNMYYNEKLKKEATHRYEYPGIHRSLLFALKAVIFYLKKEKSVYSFRKIASGYRCYDRNIQKKRQSTNHKGKALDIHFNKNDIRTKSCDDMDILRKDIFNKYLGAKWDWKVGQNNIFNLESSSIGATSWVHYDVREFDHNFLKDEYFCKDS